MLILSHADLKSLGNVEQLDFMPFDSTVKRTEGLIRDLVTGQEYKTTKGAPHVIMMLTNDDEDIKKKCEADVTSFGLRGVRCLAVAKTDFNGKWYLLGLLTFLDPPRHDTKVLTTNYFKLRKLKISLNLFQRIDHYLLSHKTFLHLYILFLMILGNYPESHAIRC